MDNQSDASRSQASFSTKPGRNSLEVVAREARGPLSLRDDEDAFELPGRLFEQLPFAIYICDQAGFVLRYNHRAAELWGRSPKLGDATERFCGSYRMFRPDGSSLPHHQCPMADVLRTGVPVRQQEVHIERPNGSRGIALVDIEAVKDSSGNIVGAVNCFQDITERKSNEAQLVHLAREAEHRTRNILATVLAAVRLSRAATPDELKRQIEGRINALAKVNALFIESRWVGADLRNLAAQELLAYDEEKDARVVIAGSAVMLEPAKAQTAAIVLHELATNSAKYGSLSAPGGQVELTWSLIGGRRLSLSWIESGGPAATPPTRRGSGTRIVESVIGQLGGEVQFDWRPEGLICQFDFPLA